MKIIQVMPFFGLGGAEIMCENLVYELIKLGHEVIVLSLYDKKSSITQRFEEAGVDIRYLHKKDGFDYSMYKKLRTVFKQEKPDIIHTHLYTTKYVFPVAASLKIKVVHTVHNVATKEAESLSRKINNVFFKHFNVVPVALSPNVQQTILDEYKLKTDDVPIVLNGIDLSKCRVKQNYDIGEVFRIIHVGRFQEVKNHVGMIEAFKKFHQNHPNSELHLIGDGERRPLIEQKVKENELSDCIIFHGFQANVHEVLSDMDVFTLPSLYEGVPMSVIEAMGTGLPIVATAVGGVPDMLDNDSAILTKVDSVQIAEAFEMYYLDADLRKKHGRAALELAERFSSKTMANKYIEIYRKDRG